MPFRSAEIRWFSPNENNLRRIFDECFTQATITEETLRIDYYLKTKLPHTTVKIREGRHELKVKSGADLPYKRGVVEQWIKWSDEVEEDILSVLGKERLTDWIDVEKKRWSKKFEVLESYRLRPIQEQFVNNGFGIEFTAIQLPSLNKHMYTLCFEGFSSTGHSKENLVRVLDKMGAELSTLEEKDSYGYATFLSQYF